MPDFRLEHLETRTTKHLTVDEDRILIGRNPSAEIPLPDSGVSKNHVVIEKNGDDYTFRDLGSSNGTRHNKKASSSGTLKHGDELRIGRVRITILLDDAIPSDSAGVDVAEVPDPPEPVATAKDRQESRPDRHTAKPLKEPPSSTADVSAKSTGRRIAVFASIVIGVFVIGIGAGAAIGVLLRDDSEATTTEDSVSEKTTADVGHDEPGLHSDEPTYSGASTKAVISENVLKYSHAMQVLNSKLPELPRNRDARYSDFEESERTLFRMYLDLLRRPPTRAEVERGAELGHLDRWRLITDMRSLPAIESLPIDAVFQLFLGRTASEPEKARLAEWSREDLALLGALLTATQEYRSSSHRRARDPDQHARSLYVDLRDVAFGDADAPAEDELDRVKKVLSSAGPSPERSTLVRMMASSSILRDPRRSNDTTSETLVRWIQSESRRFLQRSVTSEELQSLLEHMQTPTIDLRWFRMALASSEEYGSY